MTLRLGFLTTHPIQYQVPIFRLLAQRPDLEFVALFCQLPDERQQGDGFGVGFRWDVPLLEAYEYEVLRNVSPRPSVTAFRGCDTPDLADVIRRRRLDALVVNGWVVKRNLLTSKWVEVQVEPAQDLRGVWAVAASDSSSNNHGISQNTITSTLLAAA